MVIGGKTYQTIINDSVFYEQSRMITACMIGLGLWFNFCRVFSSILEHPMAKCKRMFTFVNPLQVAMERRIFMVEI